MYIAPGQGQTVPRGQSFDIKWNFLSLQVIGPMVSEEKKCGRQMTEANLSYKLTNEPLAQVS